MSAVADRLAGRRDRSTATDGRRVAWAARRTDGTDRVAAHTRLGSALLAAVLIVAVWWVLAASGTWSEIILPTPAKVWHAFIQSVTIHDGQRGLSGYYLWQHLWASLYRILRGVLWAFVIGAPLGLALGIWRPFELVVEPMVGFLRSLPPLGYFSLLIIWFGIDDTSKVWLLYLAAFPPIALSVASGVASVRIERINGALVLGATRTQLLRHTVLPSVLPDLFTGVRVAVGFAWTTIVAAETSNGIPGIGGLAWATKKELRSDVAILCVIVVGITAVLLDAVLRLAERRLVPWKGRA
jgi:taurine transport system permease protein